MKIAVIAWGSLIWDPRELSITGTWKKGGPHLPIEFARISQDGRLTLVIMPCAELQPTFWALSRHSDLVSASEELRRREGTILHHIHAFERDADPHGRVSRNAYDVVASWLHQSGCDAAIWTGLPSNWKEKRNTDFSPERAVDYFRELISKGEHHKAEEYVRRTPRSIRTPVRRLCEEVLGWCLRE